MDRFEECAQIAKCSHGAALGDMKGIHEIKESVEKEVAELRIH